MGLRRAILHSTARQVSPVQDPPTGRRLFLILSRARCVVAEDPEFPKQTRRKNWALHPLRCWLVLCSTAVLTWGAVVVAVILAHGALEAMIGARRRWQTVGD